MSAHSPRTADGVLRAEVGPHSLTFSRISDASVVLRWIPLNDGRELRLKQARGQVDDFGSAAEALVFVKRNGFVRKLVTE